MSLNGPQGDERLQHITCIGEDAAALRIGMSIAFLRKRRRLGGGPTHLRLGRCVRYRIADIDTWLLRQRR